MNVTALIMAGGKGERLDLPDEKPLVNILGKPMVQYVIDALQKSKKVNKIVTVTTKNTRKTRTSVKRLSIKVVEAPGESYISDIHYATKKLKLKNALLTVSADLPCITSEIIDKILFEFRSCCKPALCTVISAISYSKTASKPNNTFVYQRKRVAPVGVNVIQSDKIDESRIEEAIFMLAPDLMKFIINVNTKKDLMIATKFLESKLV